MSDRVVSDQSELKLEILTVVGKNQAKISTVSSNDMLYMIEKCSNTISMSQEQCQGMYNK